ncbi:MAG: hypothetical protein DHS80DRAFT_25601 [Piptocephalis tieghemiana]|nr:MAG: hypothetical protein DHS80DRAFT_25601 [Piptocephalis tieghemiana]
MTQAVITPQLIRVTYKGTTVNLVIKHPSLDSIIHALTHSLPQETQETLATKSIHLSYQFTLDSSFQILNSDIELIQVLDSGVVDFHALTLPLQSPIPPPASEIPHAFLNEPKEEVDQEPKAHEEPLPAPPPTWAELGQRAHHIYTPVKDKALQGASRLLSQLDLPPDLLPSSYLLLSDFLARSKLDLFHILHRLPPPCSLIPLLLIPFFLLFANLSSCSHIKSLIFLIIFVKIIKKARRFPLPLILLPLLAVAPLFFPSYWIFLIGYSTLAVGYFRRRYHLYFSPTRHTDPSSPPCPTCSHSSSSSSSFSRDPWNRQGQYRNDQWKRFLDQVFHSN